MFAPSPFRAKILLFVIGLYIIPDLGLTAEVVVPVARPVLLVRD
ncbi:hypothetical protein FGSG_13804 [Fusarium graminearum PH-1]|nr:hypothetical protein FGSG_13804 [Fusarium graminearum PH-1]ESU17399.1 hypothetical protein FGSG_13804 [Fusarium graminearum PH-1]|eukprot:XP_011319661.1 hypothetical protein FGSG_13804 [Fusarium graminearum PH-1]